MAYNVIPMCDDDVISFSQRNSLNITTTTQLRHLYNYISSNHNVNDGLALENNSKGNVKIIRSLQQTEKLAFLKQQYPNLTISFGNGSRGNLGCNNSGLHFEKMLYDDLVNYKDGKIDKVKDIGLVCDIIKHINEPITNVSLDGSLNQSRPIIFLDEGMFIKHDENYNIGHYVTDVTVNKNKFLSLKFGNTVTFINAGIKKLFIENDMKNGNISVNGMSLLKMLNIDHKMFLDVFNNYDSSNQQKNSKDLVNVSVNPMLKNFMKSVIGQGYLLVHKFDNHTSVTNMTTELLEKLTSFDTSTIAYPKDGSAKRIDVFFENEYISIKMNIRNKQGDVYPSHIMADYKFKKYVK
jgi:hypothetical protein